MRHRIKPTVDAATHWLDRFYWLFLLAILALSALLRFWDNDRPGFDVDELVYADIATNQAEKGQLFATPEYIGVAVPYSSHPPFLFLVEAAWFKLFGAGIIQARTLAAFGGVLIVLLATLFTRRLIGNWSLLVGLVLATDGWTVFTNRVGWAENFQIPLGIAALWFFWYVTKRPGMWRYFAGGLAVSAVFIYKTVGVVFLLGAVLYMVIQGTKFRYFLAVAASALLAVAAYAYGMYLWAGQKFIDDSYHQWLRVTGQVESRGAAKNSTDIVGLLLGQYKIYLASLAVLGLVGMIIFWRSLQCLKLATVWAWRALCGIGALLLFLWRNKSLGFWRYRQIVGSKQCYWFRDVFEPTRRAHPLLFGWTACTFLVFGVQRLTLPHYLILLLVPAICYLAAEASVWVKKPHRQMWFEARTGGAVVVALIVAGCGLYATHQRMVVQQDNAVGQTLDWLEQNAKPDDRVIADEFIGLSINQPYCKVTHVKLCEDLGGRPAYIIAYTTTTQKLPVSEALDRLIADSDPVATFTGFKEKIIIYKVKPLV